MAKFKYHDNEDFVTYLPTLLEAVEALEELIICPAFNGALFDRDKESHKAWTLGRAALAKLKGEA